MGKSPSRGQVKAQKLWREWALLIAVTAAVLTGAALWFAGRRGAADLLWAGATAVALLPAITWVVRSLLHQQVGVDVIAVLALAGALVVREYLAGAVIALMLATGRTLEAYAERRASRDLRGLLERGPRSARRRPARGHRDRSARRGYSRMAACSSGGPGWNCRCTTCR